MLCRPGRSGLLLNLLPRQGIVAQSVKPLTSCEARHYGSRLSVLTHRTSCCQSRHPRGSPRPSQEVCMANTIFTVTHTVPVLCIAMLSGEDRGLSQWLQGRRWSADGTRARVPSVLHLSSHLTAPRVNVNICNPINASVMEKHTHRSSDHEV